MYGYGPFEYPVDGARTRGGPTPPWVRVALFGPFALLNAWALAETFGRSSPLFFRVTVGSLALGYGSVLIACLYYLVTACLSKLVARGRRPDA